MEGLTHFSHEHPLILSKYSNSPADAVCYGCGDPIIMNTYVYHCSTTPRFNTGQDSSCTRYFLHKTCSTLPPNIQHDGHHKEHMLTLIPDKTFVCHYCRRVYTRRLFVYYCTSCRSTFCLKCSSAERDLNHVLHNHTLTLLPMKSLHFCGACGTKGSEDFSYLCKTCLFWIHKSCASAPPKLICKAQDNDHPLVLNDSLPEEYRKFSVYCNLCHMEVQPSQWLYYCADCRYFAHFKCVLSAIESGNDGNIYEDVEDVDDPDLVHFPVSDNQPYLLYQLIQQFAEKFSASTDERSGKADKISHCGNGHSLILFEDFNYIDVVESESSDHMICDGCVQPILPPPDSFYGCLDCNFFLHSICAAELPREFQHASHPQHKLIRCAQTGKPNAFFRCDICKDVCNGMFYSCDSCSFCIDLVCAAMPNKIKHDSHKHKLEYDDTTMYRLCDGCGFIYQGCFFKCTHCKYGIHIGCARTPGRIMHRWDEHQLCLMYPPVKGHPHDFNCERCSDDIDPSHWFYHCRKCDTSFHLRCLKYQGRFKNIKFGGIVKDDNLHQHSLKIAPPELNFKCGSCGYYHVYDRRPDRLYPTQAKLGWLKPPILKCVSCKFSVCGNCTYRNGQGLKIQKKHQ